jgi:hypothetical protein
MKQEQHGPAANLSLGRILSHRPPSSRAAEKLGPTVADRPVGQPAKAGFVRYRPGFMEIKKITRKRGQSQPRPRSPSPSFWGVSSPAQREEREGARGGGGLAARSPDPGFFS